MKNFLLTGKLNEQGFCIIVLISKQIERYNFMEKSLALIKDFVDEHLKNNIENLKTFNFENLKNKNDTKFGKMTKEGEFDADDTAIVRAICFIVWKDDLPDLKNFEDIGTGKKYRGDTLNTYNTLFGKENAGIKKYFSDKNQMEELLEKAKKFRADFQTIGNFMLMPNKSVSSKTINTYRGFCSWHDYFDRFLSELDNCLTNSVENDEVLTKLIEENDFYFSNIKDIREFSEKNFLELYLDSNGVQSFFDPCKYHWQIKKPTKIQKEEYIEFAKNYISKSTEIIEYRAEKIVEKLKLEINKHKKV